MTMFLGNGQSVSGANPIPVMPGLPSEVQGSASAANADVIPSTDVSQCMDVTFQITGTFSGTITFQASNDNTNWVSTCGLSVGSNNSSPSSSTTSTNIWFITTPFKYFRARLTSYASGTAVGFLSGNHQTTSALTVGGNVGINTSSNVVAPSPRTTGGCSVSRIISAASTNAANIKSTAGQLYHVIAYNSTASVKFIKFYNKATEPTVGTDTPFITLAVPANSQVAVSFASDLGVALSAGISIAITGALADADTTAVAAGDVVVNTLYN